MILSFIHIMEIMEVTIRINSDVLLLIFLCYGCYIYLSIFISAYANCKADMVVAEKSDDSEAEGDTDNEYESDESDDEFIDTNLDDALDNREMLLSMENIMRRGIPHLKFAQILDEYSEEDFEEFYPTPYLNFASLGEDHEQRCKAVFEYLFETRHLLKNRQSINLLSCIKYRLVTENANILRNPNGLLEKSRAMLDQIKERDPNATTWCDGLIKTFDEYLF